MSDVDTQDRTDAETQIQPEPTPKLPAAVALRGGGSIKAIIPQDFDQAYRMARIIAASGTAPKSYMMKDPTDLKEYLSVERIAVAIMHGLEVGLPPMQAVQGIAVINGMPTVYGDARDALVEASGLLEDRLEEHELDDQGLFLWWRCTVWRKGRKTPIVQEVTRVQAQRAGWMKKQGPWTESPNRMAQWRARGWAYRDAFPDVLKGLMDRDEVLDMVDVTSQGSATTPEPKRDEFKPKPSPKKKPAPTEVKAEPEPETWELFDEVGELVGEFISDDWACRLEVAAEKLQGNERDQLIINNADTASIICKKYPAEQIGPKTLRALYEVEPEQEDRNAPDYWHLGDAVIGEANIIATIKEMIDGDAVTEPKDVENILAQNQDRIRKMSPMKRQGIESHAEARHAALQKGAT